MSDERSTPSTAADDPSTVDDSAAADDDSSDSLEPGGGPERVVSEQSVDDILDSLDATESASTDAIDAADESDDVVTATFDEDDVPAADEAGVDRDTETAIDHADEESAADADGRSGAESTADAPPASDAATVDAAASSLPDDASLEELAARVDDGTVTGADVRAAEAGEGRESSPEIDEVDLSLDDLETSGSGTSGSPSETDLPDDAGPLAGSVDRDPDDEAGDDADDEPGLLGRLKRFFSP